MLTYASLEVIGNQASEGQKSKIKNWNVNDLRTKPTLNTKTKIKTRNELAPETTHHEQQMNLLRDLLRSKEERGNSWDHAPSSMGKLDLLQREKERRNSWDRVPSSMGERTGIRWSLRCRGFLAFGTHLGCRVAPGWPVRSVSFELETSWVVGKQGERGEAKVSSGQTRLRTRWRGVKERRSVRTRESGEDPSTFRFTFTFNLFKTILIGLKLITFLFYVWTEDIFLLGDLPVFVNTERCLTVVTSTSMRWSVC